MDGWTVTPLWKGHRVFIIAGGPSAPDTWRKIIASPDDRIIAIKDAAFLAPRADLFFYAEGRKEGRFHKVRPDVWNAYKGPLDRPPMRVKRGIEATVPQGVLQVRRQFKSNREVNGLALDPSLLGGHCSGGSALNLAFHLGAKEIVLVGYDLGGVHWNPDHPLPAAQAVIHARHRRSIEAMAAPLQKRGIRVLNASPVSTLKGFRHVAASAL